MGSTPLAHRVFWGCLLLVAACGTPEVPSGPVGGGLNGVTETETGAGDGTAPAEPGEESSDSEEATTGDDESGDGDDPKFDVPAGDSDGTGVDAGGCRKIDVVVAVDNSSSMKEEIDALRGPVFDSFVDTLLAVHEGLDDFHLGVVDACPKPAAFHDTTEAGPCDFSTGANFISSEDPALADSFACATQFDTSGSSAYPDTCLDDGEFEDDDEQPGLAAARATTDADGINAGFLREDALLFVVAVTDEDEALVDTESVDEIYDSLVAAKGGQVEQIVFLGVGGEQPCAGAYGQASAAPNLQALTAKFEAQGSGMFWDLCNGTLEQAFETVITQLVDPACETFTPEG